jgi:hypothetical protein
MDEGWMANGQIDGQRDVRMERWMEDGMMDGWKVDEGMDGMLKNIKIGDYIFYAKNNMKAKRKKYIQDKMKIIWELIFSMLKKNPC